MAKGQNTKTAIVATGGEVRRDAMEVARVEERWRVVGDGKPPRKRQRKYHYLDELVRLQFELIKLQEWVRKEGLRVVAVFEGRDAAGKGGVIKRFTESLNPRICRIVALGAPTEQERGQWYFQRYAAVLPARGEIVLFDRSWYNRAGVEHVMGFCSEEEYRVTVARAPPTNFARVLR
jgi:polyphosphate kinase 2 (PPK2 family)